MLDRPRPYPALAGWKPSQELFANPPQDFRPAVYWFWSKEMNPEKFRSELEEMRNAGIYSFWIQPRLGYPMEDFMSPNYFKLYRQALDIALELGMYVGIYDDYNWITGHSGGRTVAENEEYRENHTFWVEVPLKNGTLTEEAKISGVENLLTKGHKEALTWLYEGGVTHWDGWEVLGAYTYQRTDEIRESTVTNVTDKVQVTKATETECSLEATTELDPNATHFLALVTARCKTSRMIDYLNPEAIEAFIRVGYEPYYQELKDYWEHIWAMFCDEPYSGLYAWDQMVGTLGTSLMYNPGLYTEFQEKMGYDIKNHLYALIWPTDQNSTKWRNDFYQVYAERVQRIFFAPLAKWSHDHNVLFVGHELMTQLNGHWAFTTTEGFDVVANFGADHFGIGQYKDVSTTDSGSFDRNIAAKLASSVAHVYEKNGSMLEQYTPGFETDAEVPAARGDWDVSAQTLKQQMDFYAVQGLSQFLWHGYFHSNDVVGDNKALYSQRFDFPPGINFEPWFKYFRQMGDSNARLAYFLSLGTHVAPVALLYPMRTYWSKGRTDLFSREGAFYNEYLSRLHFDFDLIDERNLLTADIQDGSLRIGAEDYKVLVLPAVATLQDATVVDAIEKFVRSGGSVIFSGRIPSETQTAGKAADIRDRLACLVDEYERVIYFEEALATREDGIWVLLDTLEGLAVRSVGIKEKGKEDLGSFYCLREDSDALYLAVVNDEERDKDVEIVLPGVHGIPELWDLSTGKVTPWLCFDQTSAGLKIFYNLAAIEANCFRIAKGSQVGLHITDISGKIRESSLTPEGINLQVEVADSAPFELQVSGLASSHSLAVEIKEQGTSLSYDLEQDNDGVRIKVAPRELPQGYACGREWQLILEDGSTYQVTDTQGWEKQGLESFSGGATYKQTLEIPQELAQEQVRLVPTKVCHTMEVTVNGQECGVCPWAPYSVDVSDAIRAGENELKVFVTNTAGNAMYHGTQYDVREKAESGLIGPVKLETYRVLDITITTGGAQGGR